LRCWLRWCCWCCCCCYIKFFTNGHCNDSNISIFLNRIQLNILLYLIDKKDK
jgi:hypothetical protein